MEQQITREIELVVESVTELTGLPSRWSGIARTVDGDEFLARKRWSCDIEIDLNIANSDERWPTLVHEVIHSVSAGLTRQSYQKMRGWEEGPVENLQRMIFAAVMARLGLVVVNDLIETRQQTHIFKPFNDAIEDIRRSLAEIEYTVEPKQFYVELIGVPLEDRPGYVLDLASKRTGLPRIPFVRVFSAANAILMGRLP